MCSRKIALTLVLAFILATSGSSPVLAAEETNPTHPDSTVLWNPATNTRHTVQLTTPAPVQLLSNSEPQETLYACRWIQDFDDTAHWETCVNHPTAGTYNGELHGEDGKRNIDNHNLLTYREPTCQINGIDNCTACNYQEETPKLEHNLVGDLFAGPANYGWCYQRCDQPGCTAKQARSQPCMYDVVKAPTTTSAGLLRCYECGNEISTDKLRDKCPEGGDHWLDGVVMQYEDNPDWCTPEGDVMTCVMCGEPVIIREHLNDGVCKLDYYPFIFPEIYYVDVSDNTAYVEIFFNGEIEVTGIDSVRPYSCKGWGSWNGTASNITKLSDNYFAFELNRTSRFDDYASNGAGAYIGLRLAGYSKTQYIYVNGCFYDTNPPELISYSVTPDPSTDEWANKASLHLEWIEEGSGQVEYAIYDGGNLLKDWTYADYNGGSDYSADVTLRGVYPDWSTITIRSRDFDGRSAEYINDTQQALDYNIYYGMEPDYYVDNEIEIRHIENEAPDVTWSLADEEIVVGGTELICQVSDAHSGVRRTRLPDGSYTTDAEFRYPLSDSGIYEIMVEDNIGNCKTAVIQVDNIIPYLSAEISTLPVSFNPNERQTISENAFKIGNTSGIPINAYVTGITASPFERLVSPDTITEEQWYTMGQAQSKENLLFGLQAEDGEILWLFDGANIKLSLSPEEVKQYSVICRAGHSVAESYSFTLTLHINLEQQKT